MAANKSQPVSFDQLLRESREKRKAEQLAQEIFGKNRSSTPAGPRGAKGALGASLASRVGVVKRTASLPRSNTAPPRNINRPPPQFSRPPILDNHRPNPTPRAYTTQFLSDSVSGISKSNSYSGYNAPVANGGAGVSIRGAAAGPHIVVAQNFAPGTTAADIESVMLDVGGQMTECRLAASDPTVIAEMSFVDRSGAEMVISTFNNKKADGRTLHVFWKATGNANPPSNARAPVQEEPEPPVEPMVEDTMEIDENAQSREEQNRMREERRGRPDRGREGFPSGPKADRGFEEDYYRRPRQSEPAYQDGRYGFGGSDRYGGRGGGRYRDEGRMYSDRMPPRGGRGQSWRP